MNRDDQRAQLEAMQKKLDSFPDFILVPPRARYVPSASGDGDVVLEEIEMNDDEVYPEQKGERYGE